MSHFSVLVIGADIEKQLQPYHEFECTGTNDEFVQDIDITEKVRARMTGDAADTLEDALAYYGLEEDSIVSDESEVRTGAGTDEDAPHQYGYAIVKGGQLVKAVDRTNPNKTWDWWEIGGRWSGFLKLKPNAEGARGRKGLMGCCANEGPGYADQCLKGAVDFDGMRDEAGAKAGAEWDKAHAALAATGAPTTWRTWTQVRDEDHKDNIKAARNAYNNHPSVKAITRGLDYWGAPDEFLATREAYVQAARDRAIAPYALVKDGKWIAKGEMGWFGMSNDTTSQGDWNRKVNELLDSLPDDTQLTVVSCHI